MRSFVLQNRLLVWLRRQLYTHLKPVHDHFDRKWAQDLGLRGRLWRMFHVHEWQQSSVASSAMWVVGTIAVYILAGRFGHKVFWNIGVGIILGTIMYLLCKLRIFKKQESGYHTSSSSWIAVGIGFFFFNSGMAQLLMGNADLPTIPARIVMGTIGIAINPLRFWINRKIIFARWQFGFTLKPLRLSLNDKLLFPRASRGTTPA